MSQRDKENNLIWESFSSKTSSAPIYDIYKGRGYMGSCKTMENAMDYLNSLPLEESLSCDVFPNRDWADCGYNINFLD